MIEKRTPTGYDGTIELQPALRAAADLTNHTSEFVGRLQGLRERHASKPSLIRRLEQAGLAE